MSSRNIKDCLFNFDEISTQSEFDTLVFCEGPFDALKLDYYGGRRAYGNFRATCYFGITPTPTQVWMTYELCKKYKHTFYMPDENAPATSISSMYSDLPDILGLAKKFDRTYTDPGAMLPEEVLELEYFDRRNPT